MTYHNVHNYDTHARIRVLQYFKVPVPYQNRVLKYGIVGAALLRGAFISAGLLAIQARFE